MLSIYLITVLHRERKQQVQMSWSRRELVTNQECKEGQCGAVPWKDGGCFDPSEAAKSRNILTLETGFFMIRVGKISQKRCPDVRQARQWMEPLIKRKMVGRTNREGNGRCTVWSEQVNFNEPVTQSQQVQCMGLDHRMHLDWDLN